MHNDRKTLEQSKMPDVIVFDMDNTLVDEWGATLRPGMVSLLTRLRSDRWQLVLWTNSRAERARDILRHHDLRRYFDQCLYREDYDPDNSGRRKDIRMVGGRLLIDDDPREIDYVHGLGPGGIGRATVSPRPRAARRRTAASLYRHPTPP